MHQKKGRRIHKWTNEWKRMNTQDKIIKLKEKKYKSNIDKKGKFEWKRKNRKEQIRL